MDLFRRFFGRSNTVPEKTQSAAPTPVEIDQQAITDQGVETEDNQKPIAIEVPAVPRVLADGVTRPLPPETVISSQNEHLVFGQSTDVGMVRNNNQDSALSFFFTSRSAEERPDFGLFIVADGMGGHHDGEKASAIASRVIASYVTNNVYLPMLSAGKETNPSSITAALTAAVHKANADVMENVPEGGTTLTALAVVGDVAYVVHVGDSRLYMISKDGVEQITRDHSLVQRLIELDQLTPDEAAEHPQKNVLYRALGQSETVEVDALTRRLVPNSRLLLCSDGLWGQIKESEIMEIVTNYPNPQEACDKLVALANAHGGIDNITAILLKVPSS